MFGPFGIPSTVDMARLWGSNEPPKVTCVLLNYWFWEAYTHKFEKRNTQNASPPRTAKNPLRYSGNIFAILTRVLVGEWDNDSVWQHCWNGLKPSLYTYFWQICLCTFVRFVDVRFYVSSGISTNKKQNCLCGKCMTILPLEFPQVPSSYLT